jgi:hypothetical protein
MVNIYNKMTEQVIYDLITDVFQLNNKLIESDIQIYKFIYTFIFN